MTDTQINSMERSKNSTLDAAFDLLKDSQWCYQYGKLDDSEMIIVFKGRKPGLDFSGMTVSDYAAARGKLDRSDEQTEEAEFPLASVSEVCADRPPTPPLATSLTDTIADAFGFTTPEREHLGGLIREWLEQVVPAMSREAVNSPKIGWKAFLENNRNANDGFAITVWKDGSWKLWQTLDAKYAEKEDDWLLTIPSSELPAPAPREAAGGERDSEFEKWAISEGYDITHDGDIYVKPDTFEANQGWQARAALHPVKEAGVDQFDVRPSYPDTRELDKFIASIIPPAQALPVREAETEDSIRMMTSTELAALEAFWEERNTRKANKLHESTAACLINALDVYVTLSQSTTMEESQ